jgi:hypothetical protein
MVVLENAFVYMVGDSWDEWVMEFWYAKPEIRWVTFGMQSIEQTEEFAIAYATDVTDVHGSWLPYGMPELGVCGRKLFTIAVAVGGHRRLQETCYQRRRFIRGAATQPPYITTLLCPERLRVRDRLFRLLLFWKALYLVILYTNYLNTK